MQRLLFLQYISSQCKNIKNTFEGIMITIEIKITQSKFQSNFSVLKPGNENAANNENYYLLYGPKQIINV